MTAEPFKLLTTSAPTYKQSQEVNHDIMAISGAYNIDENSSGCIQSQNNQIINDNLKQVHFGDGFVPEETQ